MTGPYRLRRIRQVLRRRARRLQLRREDPRQQAGSFDRPPIFVIGCQRSGTSLLRRVLNSHPNIACPPESKFLLPLSQLVEHPQALKGLETMGFSRAVVLNRLEALVASFFEEYAIRNGKRRWADKTPNYVDCLPFLDELFCGKAQYVVIVRHPFDVCASFEHAFRRSGRPMRALRPYVETAKDLRLGACTFWNDQNLKIAAFIPLVASRAVSVSYELLTARPEPVLRRVIDFLGEPWDPVVLEYSSQPHDFGFEDRKIDSLPRIVTNSGKFLTWPAAERQRLADVAEEAMRAFGYTPDQPERGIAARSLEVTFARIREGVDG